MDKFFDFNTGKEFNPLQLVKQFFINPYMPQSAAMLCLEDKVKAAKASGKLSWHNKMPITIFQLSVLNLGQCMIKWRCTETGIIFKGNTRIYFRVISKDTIRIDTVC